MKMATKFITVSIEIMHDTNLNQSQKFILAEIHQLSQLDKGCIATNQHFSELIGITKENVSRNINELQQKGYINVEIVSGTRNHTRIITLTKIVRPPYQNSNPPLLKQQESKENIPTNRQINIPILENEPAKAKKFTFTLTQNKSFDQLSNEYIERLRAKIEKHNEDLFLRRLNANSPLTELYTFEDFSTDFLASGKKQKDFWMTFIKYEKYVFENESKRKGIIK
jgi:DNA-binding MarR family transcriptional regulator